VTLGAKTDTDLLRGLADATGGSLSELSPGEDLGWRTFDLVAALRTPRLTDVSAELLDGQGAKLTSPSYASARQLAQGEDLEIVARIAPEQGVSAVRLRGGWGRRWSKTYPIAKTGAGAYALAALGSSPDRSTRSRRRVATRTRFAHSGSSTS
jgi:hypothetical protein